MNKITLILLTALFSACSTGAHKSQIRADREIKKELATHIGASMEEVESAYGPARVIGETQDTKTVRYKIKGQPTLFEFTNGILTSYRPDEAAIERQATKKLARDRKNDSSDREYRTRLSNAVKSVNPAIPENVPIRTNCQSDDLGGMNCVTN